MKNYLKGSYEDYMGLDETYLKADKQRLRDIILKLAPTANRRLDRLEKNKMRTPAYRSAMEGKSGAGMYKKGRFGGVEEKSTSQLLAEYKRINNFLDNETSTVSGYQNFLDNMAEKLGFDDYYSNREEIDRFWDLYNKIKGKKPVFADGGEEYGSTQRIRKIRELMDKGFTNSEIFDEFFEKAVIDFEADEAQEEQENAEKALFTTDKSQSRDRVREARERARRGK